MPAGCGKQCWNCYWEKLARRRIRIDTAGLAAPALASRFADFGAWLIEKTGGHKAALGVHRHLAFFQQIEERWNDIPEYADLLEHFGAAGLRRHLLPRRWMEETKLISPDPAAREAESERRRITATLDRLAAGSTAREMLDGYRSALGERVDAGKLALRSMRLALTPAAAFLEAAAGRERLPPDQKTLEAFLRQTPGQRAALNGFVSYLRHTHGAELRMPKQQALQRARERRAKLRPNLLAVMQRPGHQGEIDREWVQLALQYFHDLPASAGRNLQDGEMTAETEGITVKVGNGSYWIPWPGSVVLQHTVRG